MSDLAFKYNWQEEMKNNRDSFYGWLIPVLLTGEAKLDNTMEVLSERTDKFTAVEMTIYINGVEVNAKSLLDGLYSNYEHSIERGVAEQIAKVGDATELLALADSAMLAAGNAIRAKFKEAGIELPYVEEERW